MMIFSSWKGDLSEIIARLREVALGDHAIRLVVLTDRIALALPLERALAGEVLKLYRPMKFRARLMTWGLRGMIATGRHRILGKKCGGSAIPEISWLRSSGPLGFLGCNPSHGIRCVLLSEDKSGVRRVTKLAIGSGHDSLAREARQLEKLSGEFEGIPKLGGFERGEDWTALWTGHFATPGPRRMEAQMVVPLLESWFSKESVHLGAIVWLRPAIDRASPALAGVLRKQVVRSALVHGDFAPWNLRWDDGRLMVIDWEGGCEDGIAGLDLGHGLVLESRLVEKLSGTELIDSVLGKAGRGGMNDYLAKSGWKDRELWLTLVLLQTGSAMGLDFEKELEVLENRLRTRSIIT